MDRARACLRHNFTSTKYHIIFILNLGGFSNSRFAAREMGVVFAAKKTADDEKTLGELGFSVGDFLDVLIIDGNESVRDSKETNDYSRRDSRDSRDTVKDTRDSRDSRQRDSRDGIKDSMGGERDKGRDRYAPYSRNNERR